MPDQIKEAFAKKERNSEAMTGFGFRLRNQFTVNEAYRRPKELEWLESLRQIKGLYDPDVKIEAGNSRVYPKITRSKRTIVLSRLHAMLFPDDDKNWEIDVTPEPRVSKETVKEIATGLIQKDPQTGAVTIPNVQDLNLAIKKYCKERSISMSSVIDDQLTEMDYPEETKKVLRSGLDYGTGVMKGPLITKRTKRLWHPTPDGLDYEEKVDSEDVPQLNFVRIWDWYPDASVTELAQMEGSFERHIMTKHDLRQLMKRDDFYSDMIAVYLTDHPSGNYVAKNWEVDLQVIEIEAGSGKGSSRPSASTPVGDDDANRSTNRQTGKKYEALEYWGYIDGSDLQCCGIDIPDVELEYAANIWLLGDRPIKAALYDKALDQYKVFYYEKDETSLWGEGLARIMRHSQLSISGGARMLLDNAACTSGPQVEVNLDLMVPGTDVNSFYPRKIWFREGRGVEAQYAAIRDIQFDSHIDDLLKIIEAFKNFADEETCLPTWMIGQMVNNETAQATSGRMSTITISIKDVVKNFDTFTEHIIRDLYAWNMEFNPRTDIKGDYNIKARGVSSLVMKEIRMQALTQLKTTLTPEDMIYIDHRELLDQYLKAHDVKLTLRTEEEADKIRQAQSESIQSQLAIEFQKSEISKNKAQSMSLLTKAKKVNVEATKDAQTPPEIPENASPEMQSAELQGVRTDNMGKEAEIRRKEEAHRLKMEHEDEKHRVGLATSTIKTAHGIAQEGKMSDHKLKMDEQMTKSKAKAAEIKAKQRPAAPKPAKKAK
jgi:hypothetical protein